MHYRVKNKIRNRRSNHKRRKRTIIFMAMAVLFILTFALQKNEGTAKREWSENALSWMKRQINKTYMPVFTFVEGETGISVNAEDAAEEILLSCMPVYRYSEKIAEGKKNIEDEDTYDLLIRKEGTDEERKGVEDGSLEYDSDALHIDGDLEKAMREENSLHNEKVREEDSEKEAENKDEPAEENDNIKTGDGSFCRAEEKSYTYEWQQLKEYEDIVSAFYAIDKTTSITDRQLNLENLLGRDMSLKKEGEEAQILIYHTHSQEDFADSVEGDKSTTIVGAGEKLARLLEEEYGFKVLHHTGEYDVEARDYAYSNALPAIEQVLAENPSIEVVIDLHRDAVAEGRKLMVDLQGRPTAQFMFFNGLSRTRENGDISYLENPYIDDNLAFSFQAQVACNEYYPGVARRIYLKAYRYNMHLRAKYMLVELGAQTNTVEEIMNACDPLAHVIAMVLNGEIGEEERERAGVKISE